MALKFNLMALVFAATVVVITEARAVPPGIELVPKTTDLMGRPLMMMPRDRRQTYGYPLRTMMMTGFYRPVQPGADPQGSNIYAQGSSIVGGTYFSQPQYLKDGPQIEDDSEISTAEAEAAPLHPENDEDEEEHQSDEKPQVTLENPTEEQAHPQRPASKPSKGQPKKNKKVPVPAPVPEEEEDEEYDEEDEEDDSAIAPISPQKPNKNGRKFKQYPSLNNFFPMVFTFPGGGVSGRRGSSSSGSSGTPVTAIANSYSTSKGGVASSVATAYGGAPIRRQRPTKSTS